MEQEEVRPVGRRDPKVKTRLRTRVGQAEVSWPQGNWSSQGCRGHSGVPECPMQPVSLSHEEVSLGEGHGDTPRLLPSVTMADAQSKVTRHTRKWEHRGTR